MSSRVPFDDITINEADASGHSTPRLSAPIDIPPAKDGQDHERGNGRHGKRRRRTRRRTPSEASSLSSHSSQSGESTSPTTPPSALQSSAEGASPVDVATSPLLSYFLAHASPTKSAVKFSFKNRRNTVNGISAVVEDEPDPPELPHVLHHARRLSSSWANTGTIGVQQKGPITGSQHERNTSIMRRLSLSSAMQKPVLPTSPTQPVPQYPPLSTGNNTFENRPSTPRTPRRVATIAAQSNHRAPSPMGERMLKGHFDGF